MENLFSMTSKHNPERKICLLEVQGYYIIPLVSISYVALVGLHGYAYYKLNAFSNCRNHLELPIWGEYITICLAFTLAVNSFMQGYHGVVKLFRGGITSYSQALLHFAVATLHGIPASSIFLAHHFKFGGICKDSMGVYSAATQWSEWLVTVPYLGYLTCSIVNVKSLSKMDVFLIISLVMMIILGCTVIVESKGRVFYIVGSIASMFMILFVLAYQEKKMKLEEKQSTPTIEQKILKMQYEYKNFLLKKLFSISEYFLFLYMASFTRVLSPSMTIIGFMVGSCLGKLFFSSILLDGYMNLLDKSQILRIVNEETDNTRRAFLRYVFHEIRVPLNSLSLGMQVLEEVFPRNTDLKSANDPIKVIPTVEKNLSDSNEKAIATNLDNLQMDSVINVAISQSHQKIIDAMQLAAADLVETVSQVLELHRILEGDIALKNESFNIITWFEDCLRSGRDFFLEKNISTSVEVNYGKNLYYNILGDSERLRMLVHGVIKNISVCLKHQAKVQICLAIDSLDENSNKVNSQVERKDDANVDISVMQDGFIAVMSALGRLLFTGVVNHQQQSTSSDCLLTADNWNINGKAETQSILVKLTFTSADFSLSANEMAELCIPFNILRHAHHQNKEHGTGLGFVLAKALLDVHQLGSLSFEQTSNEEITITLQWIAQANKAQNGNSEKVKEQASGSAVSQRNEKEEPSVPTVKPNLNLKVLVVDDSPSNYKILRMILEKKGMSCVIAEDGQQAVRTVRETESTFDIIFMDHTMPIMSGVEATKELRKAGYEKFIIGVTANVLEDDIRAFLHAGADAVLLKPVKIKEIDILLEYIIKSKFLHDPKIRLKLVGDQIVTSELIAGY